MNEMSEEKIRCPIDIDGPEGNVFFIMGKCKQLAQLAFDEGWSAKRIEDFLTECKSADYAHLMETVRKDFDID